MRPPRRPWPERRGGHTSHSSTIPRKSASTPPSSPPPPRTRSILRLTPRSPAEPTHAACFTYPARHRRHLRLALAVRLSDDSRATARHAQIPASGRCEEGWQSGCMACARGLATMSGTSCRTRRAAPRSVRPEALGVDVAVCWAPLFRNLAWREDRPLQRPWGASGCLGSSKRRVPADGAAGARLVVASATTR
jgi:hypothetical protein